MAIEDPGVSIFIPFNHIDEYKLKNSLVLFSFLFISPVEFLCPLSHCARNVYGERDTYRDIHRETEASETETERQIER